jgi:hypothetical protein
MGGMDEFVRREVMPRLGGSDEAVRSIYDDQALYTKIALTWPVIVSGVRWYWRR